MVSKDMDTVCGRIEGSFFKCSESVDERCSRWWESHVSKERFCAKPLTLLGLSILLQTSQPNVMIL